MSRFIIVIVLIVALVGSGLTRDWADNVRGAPIVSEVSTGQSLSAMNSYSLALLLGGLRGPLVMWLWTQSEQQKSENNLEDVDSMIEWIRLLQPEFDTVHIFQIWNKAYNISVKMTNLANKYTTILDALDYAHNVDAEKPNDINIISAIGGIYFDKFGNSAEKVYYRKRVRQESLPHPTDAAIRRRDIGAHRTEMDPILDHNYRVLPALLKPRLQKPLVDPNDHSVVYDGSEMQFLKQFEPFPYGVSPFALAYNYDRRAQLLQLIGGQRHAQLSDLVIDSRPPLALRLWADESSEFANRAELRAIGQPVAENADRLDFELNDAALKLDTKIIDRPAIDEAIFENDRAAMLYGRADAEFAAHINRYKQSEQNYQSHRAECEAQQALSIADRDYLKLLIAPPEQREALTKQTVQEYTRAINLQCVVVLKYRIFEQVAEKLYPQGVTRQNITENVPNLADLTARAVTTMEQTVGKQNFLEDSNDSLQYITRAQTRLKLLQGETPTTAQ